MQKVLLELFINRAYVVKDIYETGENTFRVKSAYGPGDFTVLPNGLIENSWAGFIGHEEKVCYIEHLDPTKDYEVVYEEMI